MARNDKLPIKYTREVHETLVQCLKRGLSREASCGIARITSKSLRTWMQLADQEDAPEALKEFALDIRAAEAEPVTDYVQDLRASQDWRAKAWLLERTRPEYREQKRSEVELSGPDGGPVNLGVVVLPPEAVIETESKATEEPADPSTES